MEAFAPVLNVRWVHELVCHVGVTATQGRSHTTQTDRSRRAVTPAPPVLGSGPTRCPRAAWTSGASDGVAVVNLCQLDEKGCAVPEFTLGPDAPTMFLDNLTANRQAQPGAHAQRFGGKKGLKDVCHDLLVNARAIVSEGNADGIPSHSACRDS